MCFFIFWLYLDFFQLCSRGCQPAGFPGVWSAPVCAASPQGGRRNEMVEPRGDNQNSNYGWFLIISGWYIDNCWSTVSSLIYVWTPQKQLEHIDLRFSILHYLRYAWQQADGVSEWTCEWIWVVGALEGAQPEAWHTTCRAVGVGGGRCFRKRPNIGKAENL